MWISSLLRTVKCFTDLWIFDHWYPDPCLTLLINRLQCTFYCYFCHTKRNLACRSTKSLFSFLSTDLVVQSTDQATEGLVHVQMSWRVFLSNICHVNVTSYYWLNRSWVWKYLFRPLEGEMDLRHPPTLSTVNDLVGLCDWVRNWNANGMVSW